MSEKNYFSLFVSVFCYRHFGIDCLEAGSADGANGAADAIGAAGSTGAAAAGAAGARGFSCAAPSGFTFV